MLSRQKGRDFYEVMFLLAQTQPDYSSLSNMPGIDNLDKLKLAAADIIEKIDMKNKKRDFEHLLFNKKKSEGILLGEDFFLELE